MTSYSADVTIMALTFNETDIDRMLPDFEGDVSEEAQNEVMHIEVPDIKMKSEEVIVEKGQRLCVVDVKALV